MIRNPGSTAGSKRVLPSATGLDVPTNTWRAAVSDKNLPQPLARPRLDSIDFLRGLVMVLMALDHTRGFFGGSGTNLRDVNDPALFLTRWVTHFCAPVFIFLAGISAFLYGSRGRTKGELSRFLLTRGVWLVVLELTLVLFGWTFNPAFNVFFLQVIWAIGWSMIALAGLIYLPHGVMAALALSIIAGHNLLDGIQVRHFQNFGWLWYLLHQPAFLQPVSGVKVLALYPLIPWIAVLAAGYALGPVFKLPERERRRTLLGSGVFLVGMFIVFRAVNGYGDPAPWTAQGRWIARILAFINCEKYPPSLLYLAMTLGPALIGLSVLERVRGKCAGWLMTFGRVPFFYYIVHIYLIHLVAVLAAMISGVDLRWLFRDMPSMNIPDGFGVSLPGVYLIWLGIVWTLFPLCRWFAALKQRRSDWWLSYL